MRPLHCAVEKGHSESTILLIDGKADLNLVDKVMGCYLSIESFEFDI